MIKKRYLKKNVKNIFFLNISLKSNCFKHCPTYKPTDF